MKEIKLDKKMSMMYREDIQKKWKGHSGSDLSNLFRIDNKGLLADYFEFGKGSPDFNANLGSTDKLWFWFRKKADKFDIVLELENGSKSFFYESDLDGGGLKVLDRIPIPGVGYIDPFQESADHNLFKKKYGLSKSFLYISINTWTKKSNKTSFLNNAFKVPPTILVVGQDPHEGFLSGYQATDTDLEIMKRSFSVDSVLRAYFGFTYGHSPEPTILFSLLMEFDKADDQSLNSCEKLILSKGLFSNEDEEDGQGFGSRLTADSKMGTTGCAY